MFAPVLSLNRELLVRTKDTEEGGKTSKRTRHNKSESRLLAAACTLDHIFKIFRVNHRAKLHYLLTQNANESQHGVGWN